MEVTVGLLSEPGPVRRTNEDTLSIWVPEDPLAKRHRGSLVILADGVGGQGHGDVASRLAVTAAIEAFRTAPAQVGPADALRRVFQAANLAVYDARMSNQSRAGMATTLTALVLRHREVTVGHVGDCRAYLIHGGTIRLLTRDHSYTRLQVSLGLIRAAEAMNSRLRNVLTRSIGPDPTIRVDCTTATLTPHDVVILCCDGLYAVLSDQEILEATTRNPPAAACRLLIDQAIKHGSEDNISIAAIRIDAVDQVSYYRGNPVFHEVTELHMSEELQIDQVLDERFKITAVISRSGMASIYRAIDQPTGQTVALKVPYMQFESDAAFYTRFQREESIGKKLRHPYILRVLEVTEPKSRPYIAMEYLEGHTLAELMNNVKPLPLNDALRLASMICEALAYMHEHNIVHRDLKPHNIMICNDGSIRIMDFGIAKAAGLRRLTFTGFSPALGTPDYMAPEQVRGKRGDGRTDLYCLGAILYEMATGRTPFEGQNTYMVMNARLTGDPVAPRKVRPELPPQIEEIILHAMERDPANRYPNAPAMKSDLDNPDRVILTGRCDRLQAPQAWRGRWSVLRWVVAIPVLLLAAFGLMALVYLLIKASHPAAP